VVWEGETVKIFVIDLVDRGLAVASGTQEG
jgi:hypothetical protein